MKSRAWQLLERQRLPSPMPVLWELHTWRLVRSLAFHRPLLIARDVHVRAASERGVCKGSDYYLLLLCHGQPPQQQQWLTW